MRWTTIKDQSSERFQRLTGVERSTFDRMLAIVGERKPSGGKGRPSKLCNADKLLMMLMCYREHRSFLHISMAYGLSEPQTGRTIRQMEDLLIKSKLFHLPSKKALLQNDASFEVLVFDVTESPVERPKKNNASGTPAKRNDTP